jgi:uncharacterized protein with HEPN domain
MQPEQRDPALLWDMIKAAKDILDFTNGLNFKQFEKNKVVRYAVERQILVIGEAAKRISTTLKEKNPHIPWDAIIGQRNILAHEYGEILVERVWLVAKENIPELIKQLKPLIPEKPED